MRPHLANFVLGVWLMASPALLGLTGSAAANQHVVGPLVATVGLVAVFEATRGVRWLNVLFGAWLGVSPLFLGYAAGPMVHSAAVGVTVAVLARTRGRRSEQLGGGWRALWRGEPS